jgi:hypothetical protein
MDSLVSNRCKIVNSKHSQGDILQKKHCNFFIKKMYLGKYREILNTFVMLLGLKLLVKQQFFKGQEFPVKVM